MLRGADQWPVWAERDRNRVLHDVRGEPVPYDQLSPQTRPEIEDQLTPAIFERKHAAAIQSLQRLREGLAASRLDVILGIGDDEDEYIHDDNWPPLLVYRGETFRAHGRGNSTGNSSPEATGHPVASELALHVLKSLIDSEFDVADSVGLEAMGHGFEFAYENLFPGKDIPIVPVIVNVFRPPNQPTPHRCYRLGQALRAAVETWEQPLRVAAVATGGLSVGILEEALDRRALTAMQTRDIETLSALPRGWMRSGSGEVLSWIIAAGACESLQMEIVDYIPGYRTEAGTGCGMAFAEWS